MEIALRQRREQALDIVDGKQAFEIIDENQEQHMLSGIFLLFRRGKQAVLRVVINHGFRKNLIVLIASRRAQMAVHEGGHLIHIKVDAGNLLRPDIADAVQTL